MGIHSHKKRKGCLDRVLFAAELDFPKILVPKLPNYSSNVNNELPENQNNCILYVTSLLQH